MFLERFVKSPHFNELNRGLCYLVSSCADYFRKLRPLRKSKPEIPLYIDFSHKILSDVNVNSILKDNAVSGLLPGNLSDKFTIKLVYKFGKTIGSKILDYNEVLKGADVASYDDITQMSCDCDSSPFRNSTFGHVITGDLDIIQDDKLKRALIFWD